MIAYCAHPQVRPLVKSTPSLGLMHIPNILKKSIPILFRRRNIGKILMGIYTHV